MSIGPDVPVRLTAEGEEQVVAALRKVVGESQKAGRAASRGFGVFNGALGQSKALLAQLGAAVTVGAFVAIAKGAAEAADQVGRMSIAVGASVKNLSALSVAAKLADVPIEQLQSGLLKLNRSVAEFEAGEKPATDAFRRLGVSIDELKGKDAAERLEVVARAFADLKDSPQKSAIGFQLLGRQVGTLLPLLQNLSDEGLAGVIANAERIGGVFNEDVAAAADAAGDKFIELQIAVQGVARNFVAGLTPAIETTIDSMTGGLAEGADAWQEFGLIVGRVIVGVANVLDPLITLIVQLGIVIGRLTESTFKTLTGDVAGAAIAFKSLLDGVTEQENALATRIQGRLDKLEEREALVGKRKLKETGREIEAPPPAEKEKKDDAEKTARELQALAAQREQFEQRRLEAEGRRHEAAVRNINAEAAQFEKVLRDIEAKQTGPARPDAAIVAEVDAFRTRLLLQEEAREQAEVAQRGLNDLKRDEELIQAAIDGHLIKEADGNKQLAAIEADRLPTLLALAAAAERAAAATGDPETIARAAELNSEIEQLAATTSTTSTVLQDVGATAKEALGDSLKNDLLDAAREGQKFVDVLRNIGQAVAEAVSQMLLLKLLGGIGLAGGGRVGFAPGGLVGGGGSGTSDSIPASLSNGEFVVRSSVVAQPGVLQSLETLNQGVATPVLAGSSRARRFADGGLVEGAGAAKFSGSVTVGLGQGLVAEHVENDPAVGDAIVRVIGKRARATRSAIGAG
jgi:hypothetical protein